MSGYSVQTSVNLPKPERLPEMNPKPEPLENEEELRSLVTKKQKRVAEEMKDKEIQEAQQ